MFWLRNEKNSFFICTLAILKACELLQKGSSLEPYSRVKQNEVGGVMATQRFRIAKMSKSLSHLLQNH